MGPQVDPRTRGERASPLDTVTHQDTSKAELFREAINTYIRVQAAKRLAALGGCAADMQDTPRHRDEPGSPWAY